MIVYHITTHAHLPGVGLAKDGNWGGIRFPDEASAAKAAEYDAGGKSFTIKLKTVTKRLHEVRP